MARRKKTQSNPSATLDNILALIDRDVKKIQKESADKQLSPQDALTLSRYASTLDTIVERTDKEKAKEKKGLDKLPTEELIKMYHDVKGDDNE